MRRGYFVIVNSSAIKRRRIGHDDKIEITPLQTGEYTESPHDGPNFDTMKKVFKKHFPDVYEELKRFYKLDTEALFKDLQEP